MTRLVPADFVVPAPLRTDEFVFEVLGPEHNERDYAAWTQSLEHIRATPGFAGRTWPPDSMTLSQNLLDLQWHQWEYHARASFAFAVLSAESGEYLGCVYFYPPRSTDFDVDVRSWVRKEFASVDKPLHDAVGRWLSDEWPWTRPEYEAR